MLEVVPVVLNAAEGDPAQAVDFENVLDARGGGDDVDVRFFADADAVAGGVKCLAFDVRVQSEVVEATVSEAVAIV